MTLARAWRRQLYGASSAALIVPSALLGALLVLAFAGVGGQAPAPVASRPAPAGPPSTQPSTPSPQPRPTPVDRLVATVTPVAEQVPAPAGPAVIQAVKGAGSAADSVLPRGVGSGAPAEGTALP